MDHSLARDCRSSPRNKHPHLDQLRRDDVERQVVRDSPLAPLLIRQPDDDAVADGQARHHQRAAHRDLAALPRQQQGAVPRP